MRTFLRNHGLLLTNLALFAVFLVGMAVFGFSVYNSNQTEHGQPEVAFGRYLVSGDFAEVTFENWESEFLQMGSYVLLTAYLIQRGSAESKKPGDAPQDRDPQLARDDPKSPWPVRRGGWVLKLYENSLVIAFGILFLASFLGHAIGGAKAYSAEELQHGGEAVTTWQYLGTPQFWFESMQNWQSEFLAVAAIVGLTIFLRQRGSSESKPVAAPHAETGA
jgi:hypothetical protein